MNNKVDEMVVCVDAAGFPASLTVEKVYGTVQDDMAARHGLIRVVDDSGEDYLYPKDLFVPVEYVDDHRQQSFLAT